MRRLALFTLVMVAFGCSEKEDDDTGGADAVVAGDLVVSGSLANGEDPDNSAVLAGQDVDILRSDGARVGTAVSDGDGAFVVEVAAGGLEVDSFGLIATDGSDTASKDFKYYLQTAVPDDGDGKALGIRKKLDLTENAVSGTEGDAALIEVGENSLKEINAITGTVTFANATVSSASVDIFVPGKSFFARTGDDGSFQLLFLPEGDYTVRIQKGVYTKDVEVTVASGKTTKLGEVEVGLLERDPLPLANVIEGTWTETCYFKGSASGSDAANPSTGVIVLAAASSNVVSTFSVSSGFSCLLDNVTAAPATTLALRIPSDEIIVRKFDSAGTQYSFNHVTAYTNNRIVFQLGLDTGISNTGKAVVVLERN